MRISQETVNESDMTNRLAQGWQNWWSQSYTDNTSLQLRVRNICRQKNCWHKCELQLPVKFSHTNIINQNNHSSTFYAV